MIVYLVTEQNKFTVEAYLREWMPALADRVRIMAYEELVNCAALPVATYIFSDVERLGPASTEMAIRLWDTLARSGHGVCLLNHPREAMRRHELLKMLADRGQNRFRAYRLGDARENMKFPVFLRIGNDHNGPATSLLKNHKELREAILVQRLRWADTREILAIEFRDTADASGMYRKYSAYTVRGQIIPRHVFFSRHWVLKSADLLSGEQAAEQMAYLRDNPHREQLREIFSAARIDYGRIDYSLLDGRIQVWEINTNPTIIHPKSDYPPQAMAVQSHFVEAFGKALVDLDEAGPTPGTAVPLALDEHLSRRVQAEWQSEGARKRRHQRMRRLLMKVPLFWWGKYDYAQPH